MLTAAGDRRVLEAVTFLSLPRAGVELPSDAIDRLQDRLSDVISDHSICSDGLQALLVWHERQDYGHNGAALQYSFWELVTLHGVDENE